MNIEFQMLGILIVICGCVASSFGWTWTELELDDGVTKQSGYIDFDPTTTRIQMRLTQLLPDDNLQFRMEYEFFEEPRRDKMISSLIFDWKMKEGYQSKVSLYVGATFTDCDLAKPEMSAIPTFASIDLTKDYIVEMDDGFDGSTLQGSFEGGCEAADDGIDTWEIWKKEARKIGKLNVKLVDGEFHNSHEPQDYAIVKIQDYFMVECRLVQECPAGQYICRRAESCVSCKEGTYSAGGFAGSCTACPTGTTVASGLGARVTNCTGGDVVDADDSDSGATKHPTTAALVQAFTVLLLWLIR